MRVGVAHRLDGVVAVARPQVGYELVATLCVDTIMESSTCTASVVMPSVQRQGLYGNGRIPSGQVSREARVPFDGDDLSP
jgi:hypothetical protein